MTRNNKNAWVFVGAVFCAWFLQFPNLGKRDFLIQSHQGHTIEPTTTSKGIEMAKAENGRLAIAALKQAEERGIAPVESSSLGESE